MEDASPAQLLEDLAAARALAAAAQTHALEVEAELANVRAQNSDLLARNALLELQAEKMRRSIHGPSAERSRRSSALVSGYRSA